MPDRPSAAPTAALGRTTPQLGGRRKFGSR